MDPISIGLTLLGGAFKARAARKAAERERKAVEAAAVAARAEAKADAETKYVDMSRAAQAGGFNPLTVLQYTGGAGYGAGAYGPNAGLTAVTSTQSPALASLGALNDTVDAVVTEMSGQNDARRENDRLTNDLLRIERDRAKAGLGQSGRSVVSSIGGNAGSGGSSPGLTGWFNDNVRPIVMGAWDNWATAGLGVKAAPTHVSASISGTKDAAGDVYYFLGNDGEAWDPAQVAMWSVQVAPQFVVHKARRLAGAAYDAGGDLNAWLRERREAGGGLPPEDLSPSSPAWNRNDPTWYPGKK